MYPTGKYIQKQLGKHVPHRQIHTETTRQTCTPRANTYRNNYANTYHNDKLIKPFNTHTHNSQAIICPRCTHSYKATQVYKHYILSSQTFWHTQPNISDKKYPEADVPKEVYRFTATLHCQTKHLNTPINFFQQNGCTEEYIPYKHYTGVQIMWHCQAKHFFQQNSCTEVDFTTGTTQFKNHTTLT